MRAVADRVEPRETTPSATMVEIGAPGDTRRLLAIASLAGVVVCAASLALSTRTGMWLDEAQTVAIARMPVGELLDGLRTDGAPPLYYLLLHGWMAVVGTSEIAVRALSAVFAAGTVALAPLAGYRLGGRRVAITATALFATIPFMHRYATEARMYTLVSLLVLAGFLALQAALEKNTPRNLAVLAGVTGLLLLTHYWSVFLIATVVALLVARAVGNGGSNGSNEAIGARRALTAMAAGLLLFLPWAPSFLYQVRHTGAPWGEPAGPWIFEVSLQGLVGGRARLGVLGFLMAGLLVLGIFGRALPRGRIELDLSGRPRSVPLALTIAGTLCLAVLVSQLTETAFAPRYAAVVVVPFLLLAALGLCVVEHRTAFPLLAAAVMGLGLVRSADEAMAPRTQARQLAAAVERKAQPGDLLAFCPDQLRPAVKRLVPTYIATLAYPPGSPASRVNWVDYDDRIKATPGRAFAESVDRRAGEGAVWLVMAPGYHSLGKSCERVLHRIRQLRPGGRRVQAQNYSHFEHASLWRLPPTPGT